MIATATDRARARAGGRRARADRVGRHAGRGRRADAHPHRAPGRPEDRRSRSVRQPAPALHRLQGAQHGAPRRRRPQGPARLRVRRARRRHRRDPSLRDRGARSTRCSGCSTSSRSCARTAASSRPPQPGTLPELIELGDLRGDLHCHTTASDGTASIEEMAIAAREAGYEYLAITDHSASFGFGDDLSPDRLREQIERIRATRGRRDRAARRQRGQHPPRRLARLRRRGAGRARLGGRERALVVPDGLATR